MQIPTLHINGTSKEGLLNPIREAAILISKARESFTNTCPHNRDYYPQGDNNYAAAREEWRREGIKLNEVYDYLEKLFVAIDNGGYKKGK
jgi:hypothetical protein